MLKVVDFVCLLIAVAVLGLSTLSTLTMLPHVAAVPLAIAVGWGFGVLAGPAIRQVLDAH